MAYPCLCEVPRGLLEHTLHTAFANFIVQDRLEPCWDCGEPTCFIEINFEAALHPGACEARKDAEFWAAQQAAGPIDMEFP